MLLGEGERPSETHVQLSTPQAGSTFELQGKDADDEELTVFLGAELSRQGPTSVGVGVAEPSGYPIPSIQEELTRLRERWRRAGYADTEFGGYRVGEGHEEHLRDVRRKLRAAGV